MELITLLISSLDLRLALGINLYLLVIFEDSIRDKSVEKGIKWYIEYFIINFYRNPRWRNG